VAEFKPGDVVAVKCKVYDTEDGSAAVDFAVHPEYNDSRTITAAVWVPDRDVIPWPDMGYHRAGFEEEG
jgi:hypothetical protein